MRRRAKASVRLVSMTQNVRDDPTGIMIRQGFALFDERPSAEIRKHVSGSMNRNARQVFWNGAAPPCGYTTVVVEQRGARMKRKLAIDPVEAEIRIHGRRSVLERLVTVSEAAPVGAPGFIRKWRASEEKVRTFSLRRWKNGSAISRS